MNWAREHSHPTNDGQALTLGLVHVTMGRLAAGEGGSLEQSREFAVKAIFLESMIARFENTPGIDDGAVREVVMTAPDDHL
jgi:hypothetical protein